MLGFVAQDQTNISADSLRVAIDKPFREVLAPVALNICVLDRLHFDIVGRRWLSRIKNPAAFLLVSDSNTPDCHFLPRRLSFLSDPNRAVEKD